MTHSVEQNGRVKYRVMTWCSVECVSASQDLESLVSFPVMIAPNISLGILSLSSAITALGIGPAVVLIVFLSRLSCYTALVIGKLKLRYPEIHSMSDAGVTPFGRLGEELLNVTQLIFLVYLMASHVLSFPVLMNEPTDDGACTIVLILDPDEPAVHGSIFGFLSETENPRNFPKSFAVLQVVDTFA
ncbi:uncharacterized protein ATNIH1004_005187 [Aspergillus tanneri]|uniref:Amino acid transporter transmembrane domain-containing protein n=1 Tax=Aspergillus tanneri TaxID=1220188 RepID=A0A5M9MTL4_9EURO|nr:uncharacterized protein ATNIH1004_005187 [Aspergillus tanneri]KAA8649286.1 hypothetical protein ATNIH1004_005187 [Aspergillus tanneri]